MAKEREARCVGTEARYRAVLLLLTFAHWHIQDIQQYAVNAWKDRLVIEGMDEGTCAPEALLFPFTQS